MGSSFLYDGVSLQNQRAVNMDSLFVKVRNIDGMEICLAAVCDGVGSLADGAFAASSAVRMLNNWFENLESADRLNERLRSYITSINTAILAQAQKKQIETACTLSCLLLWDKNYNVFHVGDSRIYMWESGRLQQLTQDQVQGGHLISALGHKKDIVIFCAEGIQEEEQRFLLCSDGLYKRMDPELLLSSMQKLCRRNIKKTIYRLTNFVIERGERDNISAALLINSKR